jgi:hypothetical protein
MMNLVPRRRHLLDVPALGGGGRPQWLRRRGCRVAGLPRPLPLPEHPQAHRLQERHQFRRLGPLRYCIYSRYSIWSLT